MAGSLRRKTAEFSVGLVGVGILNAGLNIHPAQADAYGPDYWASASSTGTFPFSCTTNGDGHIVYTVIAGAEVHDYARYTGACNAEEYIFENQDVMFYDIENGKQNPCGNGQSGAGAVGTIQNDWVGMDEATRQTENAQTTGQYANTIQCNSGDVCRSFGDTLEFNWLSFRADQVYGVQLPEAFFGNGNTVEYEFDQYAATTCPNGAPSNC